MSFLLQDYVSKQAELRPDTTAIVLKDQRVSYSDLEIKSNQLAHMLKKHGVGRSDRVCLLM